MNDITKIQVDGEPESSYQLYPRNNEFAKRAGGGDGGSGTQSDWNQNDETQPDYVKNRPFYTGDPVETVLLEETAFEFENAGDHYQSLLSRSFALEIGQTYLVSWDGTIYSCVCAEVKGIPIIGNLYTISTEFADTGEPFIIVNDGEFLVGQAQDASASHTISVRVNIGQVTKINKKYLPEDSPYLSNTNPTGTGSFSLNRLSGSEIGYNSFAEGQNTTASGDSSHAEGANTRASGDSSHAEGANTRASRNYSHAEGKATIASGVSSHAEGNDTIASGDTSHAEGNNTKASGISSHAEGDGATASGAYSHAEGQNTTALGENSHAEGYSLIKAPTTITSSTIDPEIINSWKSKKFTLAKGSRSHAEGDNVLALALNSHAEGYQTIASNTNSHAEGNDTIASGVSSHAEGNHTTASGSYSHAEGCYTKASSDSQHVQGKYNIEDSSNTYAHIVGNGTIDNARSNAHTLDWSGNAWFAGTIEGKAIILPSSTADSTKKFKITVDDSGTITATEVT